MDDTVEMDATVGSIMVQPRVLLSRHLTAGAALDAIRDGGRPTYCLVVDGSDTTTTTTTRPPCGYVASVDLCLSDPAEGIEAFLRPYTAAQLAPTDPGTPVRCFAEQVAPLPSGPLPVVGMDGSLLGAIGANAVATALSGMSDTTGLKETPGHEKLLSIAKQRIVWLLITFGSTLLSVAVVDEFKDATSHIEWAPALMPVCGAMGGNAGLQVGTAVIEGLSLRSISPDLSAVPYILRELTICTLCGFFFAVLFGTVAGWYEVPIAGVMTGVSLFGIFVWSALAGTIIPLALTRFGVDPVVSVGPVLTTATDVVGYVIFLGLCTMFVTHDSEDPV